MKYGEKLTISNDPWEVVDEILNKAVIEYCEEYGEEIELEILYDNHTSEENSRLYEVRGEGWDFSAEVSIKACMEEEIKGVGFQRLQDPQFHHTGFMSDEDKAHTALKGYIKSILKQDPNADESQRKNIPVSD